MGAQEIIYTSIKRDGTMRGPDVRGARNILKDAKCSVILSGGFSSVADIEKVKCLEQYGLKGIIVGRALYTGQISLPEAIAVAGQKPPKRKERG